MSSVSLYPVYSRFTSETEFTFSPYTFFYKKNEEKFTLTTNTPVGGVHALADENSYWNADDYELGIHRSIQCTNAHLLYGKAKNAIAERGSTLGIALSWSSADSNQRGTVEIGAIKCIEGSSKHCLDYVFPKGTLRGEVNFSIILYLKSNSSIFNPVSPYANVVGTVLGTLDTFKIKLDGKGSFFPVQLFEDNRAPLWKVFCLWDDPVVDAFHENVIIMLNTQNKGYKFIDRKDKEYNREFAIEVFSSAISTIIEYLRNEQGGLNSVESPERGSVMAAINYFRDTHGWDMTDPIKLTYSIREFLNKIFPKK